MTPSPEAQRLAIIAHGLGLRAESSKLQEFMSRLPGSLDDRVRKVSDAVIARFAPPDKEWKLDVMGVWEDHAIFEKQGKLFKIPYTLADNGDVTLGDQSTEVSLEIDASPKESSAIGLTGLLAEAGTNATTIREIARLSEGVDLEKDFPVKVIQAGRGSSGFYPKAVLQRDGPKAFPRGTKMFMNHSPISERLNQPERRIQDLAGVTTSEPYWSEDGAEGAGLYARCQVFSDWRKQIGEKAAHTGVSIVASGVKEKGQEGDFKGLIIKEIKQGHSIDFVTTPGAGGKALPLAESAAPEDKSIKETITMTAEEVQKIMHKSAATLREEFKETLKPIEAERDELKAQLARRQEADITAEASSYASTEAASLLKDVSLSEIQRTGALSRVVEKVAGNPPLKEDGTIAKVEFREKIAEAVKAEVKYIAEVSGGGKPKDLGGSSASLELPSEKELKESMAANFQRLGLDKDAAAKAAEGRVH
jgi:hypothetical protein